MGWNIFSKFNIVKGTSQSETVQGTPKNDILLGGAGDDLLKSGAGNDIAFGGAGNDVINGGTGFDILFGGSGSDRLTAGGTGLLIGGKGADVFRVDAVAQKSYILDFNHAGGDRIDIPAGFTFADAKIVDNGLSFLGVTVSFSHGGVAGPQMVLFGVDKPSDVHADWFI